MSFEDVDRGGINHTCSSSARCPNHNYTHYSCSSLSVSCLFPPTLYRCILRITVVLAVSLPLLCIVKVVAQENSSWLCVWSLLHANSKQRRSLSVSPTMLSCCASHTHIRAQLLNPVKKRRENRREPDSEEEDEKICNQWESPLSYVPFCSCGI